MSEHRAFLPLESVVEGDRLTISGDEALHAVRVKRCQVGDALGLLDGRGGTATARIASIRKDPGSKEWQLEVLVERRTVQARPRPRVEVWSAVPKGGRLDDMIDQLSQIGACAWAPLHAARSVAEPTGNKAARLDRIVRESAKQCGRPWLLEIGPGGDVREALAAGSVLFADAPGAPFVPLADRTDPDAKVVRVLVGPEGGWTDDERRAAREAGAVCAAFGPHAMRIETAAVAATAIVLDQLNRAPARSSERGSR